MNELTELLQQVATNLSGHPCRVRWRRPAWEGVKAACFKNGNQAIIDIDPRVTWSDDKLLFTLCHEAGHIKDLWGSWGDGIPDIKSESLRVPKQARALPGVVEIEKVADDQADIWMAYAKANYTRYTQPGDIGTFAPKLRALIDYKK